jgi:hypothetical protein
MNSLIRLLSRNFWLKIALCALLFAGVGIFTPSAFAEEILWQNSEGSPYPDDSYWHINLGAPESNFSAENLILSVQDLEATLDPCVYYILDLIEYYDSGYNSASRYMNQASGGLYDPILDEPKEADGLFLGDKNNNGFWKVDLNQNTDFSTSKYYRITAIKLTDTTGGACAGTGTIGGGNTPSPSTKTGGEVVWQIGNGLSAESYLIDFVFPENEQTTEDFISWQILSSSPELDPEETPRYYIVVAYNREGSEDIYTDGYYSLGGVDLYSGIFKSQILTGGIWEATAKIFYNDFEDPLMLMDSETITFTIGISDESGIPLPEGVDCNSGNFIADSFCHIITYLFIPSSESLNLYQNLLDPIKSKAPFGYFTLLKDALTGLGESTPAFDLNVEGFGFFGMIKTGLVWIIWLWVGVGVFKRLAHLEI